MAKFQQFDKNQKAQQIEWAVKHTKYNLINTIERNKINLCFQN